MKSNIALRCIFSKEDISLNYYFKTNNYFDAKLVKYIILNNR